MKSKATTTLQGLCYEGEFAVLVQAYQLLLSPTPEEHFWGAIGLMATGRNSEAIASLEQSLAEGYREAAAPFAGFLFEAGELERAKELLDTLEPFDELEPWAKAFAYRERGQLFEIHGQFSSALEQYKIAWDLFKRVPGGHTGLGYAGQLLSWAYELFSQSKDALEIIREAKQYARANRRVQLLYFQVLASSHVDQFDEAHMALKELEVFVPDDPNLQGLASQAAGVLARLEGRWLDAIEHFENVIVVASGAQSEAPIGANLFASSCSLILGNVDGATKYLERAEREFSVMDPFLVPAHAYRARAAIGIRRGALEVVRGNPAALDHLESALQSFRELGLPLDQCLALLHMADWYAKEGNEPRALELLRQAHALKEQFQDRASYRVELAGLPRLAPLSLKLVMGEAFPEKYETVAARGYELFSRMPAQRGEREQRDQDELPRNVRRLVLSGALDEAIRVCDAAQTDDSEVRAWAGLAHLLRGEAAQARRLWTAHPADGYRKEYALLQSIIHFIDHLSDQAVQFSVFGKAEINLVREQGGQLKSEQIKFSVPRAYELFALLVERHGAENGVSLEEVLEDIWSHVSQESALIEFKQACAEIDALGAKLLSSSFAVRRGVDGKYRLELIGLKTGLRELDALPIAYLPLELETKIGFGDMALVWALCTYRRFMDGTLADWALRRRTNLELALLERGMDFLKRLKAEGDEGAAMLLAQQLSTLEVNQPFSMWAAAKAQIQEIVAQLTAEPHLLPGALQLQVTGTPRSESALAALQEELKKLGWHLLRVEPVARPLSESEKLEEEFKRWQRQLSDEEVSEDEATTGETFELISARLIPQTQLESTLVDIKKRLAKRRLTDVHLIEA